MVARPAVSPDRYKVSRGKSVTLINLWPDKGAEIFYKMAEEFPEVPFLGVIGGYGEQVIRDLPNVTIMEHTPDMKKVYGDTKILLMPSKYESYGRVGVEAMASGIPVIAHPTEGLRESLGDAGTFVDRDLPGEWKTALSGLLKPARYGKMSKLATTRSELLYKQSSTELEMIPMFLRELIRVASGKRV
jgi:glycosyltransferase involved in cell wall biosynthesis